MRKNRLIIDLSNFIYANYFIAEKLKLDITPEVVGNRVQKQISKIVRLISEDNRVVSVVVAVDSKSFRHDIEPFYKSGRVGLPFDKSEILPYIQYRKIQYEGLEADDIIYLYSEKYNDVIIVSEDKDMYQCVKGTTVLYKYKKNKLLDESNIDWKYELIIKILYGDSSDNIPKVIDRKKLKHGTVKNIYNSLNPHTTVPDILREIGIHGYPLDYDKVLYNMNMVRFSPLVYDEYVGDLEEFIDGL